MSKNICCFFLICAILLMPFSVSAESKPITKENTFTTDDENFNYDFDKNIKIKDKEYKLSDVQYTILDKTPKEKVQTVEKNVTFKKLKKRSCNADKQLQIECYGQSVTVYLTDISYEKNTVTGKTKTITEKKDLGISDEKPNNVPASIDISNNGNNATLSLMQIEEVSTQWVADADISITCKKYNKSYYELGNGILIDSNNQTSLNGYETEIANILNLDTTNQRVNAIKWVGEDFKKGSSTYRKAVVTCQKKSKRWQAVYSGNVTLPDKNYYTATAHYVGTVKVNAENDFTYKVKATATYELIQQNNKINLMPYVYVAGAVVVIVGAVVLIILFIMKRKRRALGY